MIVEDPTIGWTKPYKEHSRDRVLSDEEIGNIWKAADLIGYPFGTIVQLLFLTGKRLREVADMRWTELDLDTGI